MKDMIIYKYPKQKARIENLLEFMVQKSIHLHCDGLTDDSCNLCSVMACFFGTIARRECTEIVHYRILVDANKYGGFTPLNNQKMRFLMEKIYLDHLTDFEKVTSVQKNNVDGQYILNIVMIISNSGEEAIGQSNLDYIYQALVGSIIRMKDDLFLSNRYDYPILKQYSVLLMP